MAKVPENLRLAMSYIQDVLDFDSGKIDRSRANFTQSKLTDNLIVVDVLSEKVVARSKSFDSENEIETVILHKKAELAIDFYGVDALDNAQTFEAALTMESGYNTFVKTQVRMYHPTNLINVKILQGKQYGERWQINTLMRYDLQKATPVRRITSGRLETLLINK